MPPLAKPIKGSIISLMLSCLYCLFFLLPFPASGAGPVSNSVHGMEKVSRELSGRLAADAARALQGRHVTPYRITVGLRPLESSSERKEAFIAKEKTCLFRTNVKRHQDFGTWA